MPPDSDPPTVRDEGKAIQAIKLGSMRYVLGISLAIAFVCGVAIWNIFAR